MLPGRLAPSMAGTRHVTGSSDGASRSRASRNSSSRSRRSGLSTKGAVMGGWRLLCSPARDLCSKAGQCVDAQCALRCAPAPARGSTGCARLRRARRGQRLEPPLAPGLARPATASIRCLLVALLGKFNTEVLHLDTCAAPASRRPYCFPQPAMRGSATQASSAELRAHEHARRSSRSTASSRGSPAAG